MKALTVITPFARPLDIEVRPESQFATAFLKKKAMDIRTPYEYRVSFKAELKRRGAKL